MRETVGAYMGKLRRAGLECQQNSWPYPQGKQSHIAVWRKGEPAESCCVPDNHTKIYLVNTDRPGALIRIAEAEPTAAEIIRKLAERKA